MTSLLKTRSCIDALLNEPTSPLIDINSTFMHYEKLSSDFMNFLKRARTEESLKELATHKYVLNTLKMRKDLIVQQRILLKPAPPSTTNPEKHTETLPSEKIDRDERWSQYSPHRSSHRPDVSSEYLRTKAKAEAAKVRLMYAEKEALLEREAAEKQAQLKIIKTEKEYTEATAKLKVLDEYFNENLPPPSIELPGEQLSSRSKVELYLDSHGPSQPKPFSYVQSPGPSQNLRSKQVPSVSSLHETNYDTPFESELRAQASEFIPSYLPPPDMFAYFPPVTLQRNIRGTLVLMRK
ncbi:uncharacterized protein LOC132561648 [Ylistrum balloti]|uniref:uncharacterized protein LOC132561648 n=1 Tax=Ylistrum balloti TaxID=509963 RepID=UPI002905E56B|nr:uncharacterized protein LOC132561648 [Ylistrum balloti]